MDAFSPMRASEAQIWFYSLAASSTEIACLRSSLDRQERMRADRFRFEADRDRFVIAHGRLRELLGTVLNVAPELVRITQMGSGKPVLEASNGLHFNLSHSGDIAVAGLATQPIGVDVEIIRPLIERDQITARYFAPNEIHTMLALPEAARHQAFFTGWTRKEAFAKAIGLGLAAPFKDFEVSMDQPALICAINERSSEAAKWSLAGAALSSFAWAAAVRNPGISFVLHKGPNCQFELEAAD